MNYRLTTPPIVEAYYDGEEAYITQDYHPDRGWQSYAMRKRISPSYARKLKEEGVTAVSLVPVSDPGRAPADFQISELIPRRTRS